MSLALSYKFWEVYQISIIFSLVVVVSLCRIMIRGTIPHCITYIILQNRFDKKRKSDILLHWWLQSVSFHSGDDFLSDSSFTRIFALSRIHPYPQLFPGEWYVLLLHNNSVWRVDLRGSGKWKCPDSGILRTQVGLGGESSSLLLILSIELLRTTACRLHLKGSCVGLNLNLFLLPLFVYN